jgi:hypothetical protein
MRPGGGHGRRERRARIRPPFLTVLNAAHTARFVTGMAGTLTRRECGGYPARSSACQDVADQVQNPPACVDRLRRLDFHRRDAQCRLRVSRDATEEPASIYPSHA